MLGETHSAEILCKKLREEICDMEVNISTKYVELRKKTEFKSVKIENATPQSTMLG